ncbi:molybdopterin converting factor subunit 1 [Parasulfuritortus cantonensis]|uniref:Molybdopterin synthase sulfur carrier subunit n=1 Tax=Parasulfuritortus cantonensis TaxID=2528202 RepID=A0A4R1BE92_9PROT|nr:molybdopterin converting factor subunit 1 [Parasulfuritortus cantonensis]TCJ15393.1 molybdopterin converting factor subunit 1 [Parasulfuritortus cantonensis]
MNINVLYFARLREAFGTPSEEVELAAGDVADLLALLCTRGKPWADELSGQRAFRVAVNQDLAGPDTALADGDEVAIFPPVTGG